MAAKIKVPTEFNTTTDPRKAALWVPAAEAKYGEPFVVLHNERVIGLFTVAPASRWSAGRPAERTSAFKMYLNGWLPIGSSLRSGVFELMRD